MRGYTVSVVLVALVVVAIGDVASASDLWLEQAADGFKVMMDVQGEVIAFELKIKVQGEEASFSILKGDVISDWMLFHNYKDGHIFIWAASVYPIPMGEQTLVVVSVEGSPKSPVSFSLVEAQVNEMGPVRVATKAGLKGKLITTWGRIKG